MSELISPNSFLAGLHSTLDTIACEVESKHNQIAKEGLKFQQERLHERLKDQELQEERLKQSVTVQTRTIDDDTDYAPLEDNSPFGDYCPLYCPLEQAPFPARTSFPVQTIVTNSTIYDDEEESLF